MRELTMEEMDLVAGGEWTLRELVGTAGSVVGGMVGGFIGGIVGAPLGPIGVCVLTTAGTVIGVYVGRNVAEAAYDQLILEIESAYSGEYIIYQC